MNCRACESDLPRRTGNRGRPPLYCSAACREAGVRAYRQAHKDEVNAWRRAHDTRPRKAIEIVSGRCAHCGAEFIGRDTKKFCSKSCKSKFGAHAFYVTRAYQAVCDLDGCDRLIDKPSSAICQTHRQRMRVHGSYELPVREVQLPEPRKIRYCVVCTSELPKGVRSLCSDACALERKRQLDRAYNAKRPKAEQVVIKRTCAACSVVFETIHATQKYHTRHCGERRSDQGKARHKAGVKMRALRLRLWTRDHSCYLCGQEIDYSIKYPDDMSPQPDHLTPFSMGGTTTLDNLAMTHKRCNQEKADADATWWQREALSVCRVS